MRVALPTVDGRVSAHFGHCTTYRIYDIEGKDVKTSVEKASPKHEPGVIPNWLKSEDVNLVIAGGMGHKAIQLFHSLGIQTIVGVENRHTDEVIQDYLQGILESKDNLCDH